MKKAITNLIDLCDKHLVVEWVQMYAGAPYECCHCGCGVLNQDHDEDCPVEPYVKLRKDLVEKLDEYIKDEAELEAYYNGNNM